MLLAFLLLGSGASECLAQVHGKLGAGSGLPYGVLVGVGGEIELFDRIGVLAGVGAASSKSPVAYGARVYFEHATSRWRPNVSLLHWTEGNGLYVGVDQDVGRPGAFIVSYGLGFGAVNLEGHVGMALGIGYRW